MKTLQYLAVVTLLGFAPGAFAQINMPDPSVPGASINNPVRVVATNDMMVDRFIKRWLRTHYPGWDADPHEYMEMGNERYAVVYITSANNPGRRVYFRVQQSQNEDASAGFPPL
ncbi:MAG TPA: hypothetical protein VFU13_02220 [Steroidobacteraceae bacterium]|nr:hypothetical protein [Steroidobacteraceae bacterium]